MDIIAQSHRQNPTQAAAGTRSGERATAPEISCHHDRASDTLRIMLNSAALRYYGDYHVDGHVRDGRTYVLIAGEVIGILKNVAWPPKKITATLV